MKRRRGATVGARRARPRGGDGPRAPVVGVGGAERGGGGRARGGPTRGGAPAAAEAQPQRGRGAGPAGNALLSGRVGA